MAFDINSVIGSGTNWAASFLDGQLYSGVPNSPVVVNADGSYTVNLSLSINMLGGTSIEDSNTGFPDVVALHDLGLPGNPGFAGQDIPGLFDSVYTGSNNPFPGAVILQAQVDASGTPNIAGEVGGEVVAYSPQGFLVETLVGFDTGFGGGYVNSTYYFYSTGAVLNTLDSSSNPVPPQFTSPLTLEPLSYNFPTCFASGTRIATPDGEVAVEDLRAGDAVLTAAGENRPVVWLGERHVEFRRRTDLRDLWPVRIEAGAFGDAPSRPLLLSPDHAVFADGVLIPVRRLVNGSTIRQVAVDRVTYHHVQLATHDVLLAEGLAAESFLDAGGKDAFAGGPVQQLRPDFGARAWEAEGCAPLVLAGPELDRLVARLDEIAARLMPRLRAA